MSTADMLRTWWQSEMYQRGADALRAEYETRSVSTMTTNDNDYEVAQRIALLIQDEAEQNTDGVDPKKAATDTVENVLDNGWIWGSASPTERRVWEIVILLGYNTATMDPFAVFQHIARLIEENDLFND